MSNVLSLVRTLRGRRDHEKRVKATADYRGILRRCDAATEEDAVIADAAMEVLGLTEKDLAADIASYGSVSRLHAEMTAAAEKLDEAKRQHAEILSSNVPGGKADEQAWRLKLGDAGPAVDRAAETLNRCEKEWKKKYQTDLRAITAFEGAE